jgi:prepilin-type N-terminal cleavage/methylation domain-containing protein
MQIAKSALQIKKRGFTLIEVLIGTFLILIVFLGIFGAYRLGLKVVGLSKNKIIATAITNDQIEKIRNLPYSDLGTKNAPLPYAQGVLDSATTTVLNNLEYQIETKVKFIVDEADGTGAADSCNWDYKRAEVKVSWTGSFAGEVKLTTDVAPKDIIEEVQTCQAQPGGILSVLVFDAFGSPVPSPLMEVFNPETDERVDFATPADGSHDFPLATSTYKVVVSKGGYSSEKTYGADEIATPAKPNPIILVGQITPTSFSIDRLSSFSVDTLSSWGTEIFSDTFSNESKISEKSNVVIANGEVNLATTTEGYYPSGFLTSIAISPANLIRWDKFSFSDSRPANTDLRYRIYYASGTEWYLISDADLPGNSTGFDASPVDLSNLATSTYFQLKLRVNFSTNSTTTTPSFYDWQISWITSEPTPVSSVNFNLQGEKIIGKDADENPVYKYSISTTSDSNGHISLTDLEWDNYTFSVNFGTGLDLVSTDPSPQPISLVPGTNLPVKLYLDSQNSLLVTVQNIETLELVFSAGVRLFNLSLAYDKTQYTNEKGQTYFIPLEPANYDLEIQASGYNSTSTTVLVSGDVTKTVKLEQIE